MFFNPSLLLITYFAPNVCIRCEKGPKMSTTRYKDPIPEGVSAFTTLDEAAKIQRANPFSIPGVTVSTERILDAPFSMWHQTKCVEIDRRNAELGPKVAVGKG